MLPVRTHHLPALGQVPEASVDGTPRIDPLEQAMKIVEAEKQKVQTYAEQLREERENEEIPCNPDQDFSFLRICKMGKSNITHSNPILNPIAQVRVSPGMRPTVVTPISPGRNASGPTQCSSATMPKRTRHNPQTKHGQSIT